MHKVIYKGTLFTGSLLYLPEVSIEIGNSFVAISTSGPIFTKSTNDNYTRYRIWARKHFPTAESDTFLRILGALALDPGPSSYQKYFLPAVIGMCHLISSRTGKKGSKKSDTSKDTQSLL